MASKDPVTWPYWTRTQNGVRLSCFSSEDFLERLEKFQFDDADVMVTGHPRSGNHWLGELAWLILNNGNVKQAKEKYIDQRGRFLEADLPTDTMNSTDWLTSNEPPRIIKTHLPPDALRKKLDTGNFKIIVVLRNPKDMLASDYRGLVEMLGYTETWDECFQKFKEDKLPFECVFSLGPKWWNEAKVNPNVFCIHYEELKADPEEGVGRMAKHLGRDLSAQQIKDIVEYATVDNMRKNLPEELRCLIKEGKVGGRKKYFSPEQEKWVDEKMKEVEKECGLKWMHE